MTTGQFEINTATVVSDIIEGEAVMITLDTGAYYSMNEIGFRIRDRRGEGGLLVGRLLADPIHEVSEEGWPHRNPR